MLWGLNWPIMKVAVGELSPWTFRVVCVVVSGVGLLAIAPLPASAERTARHWRPLLVVAACSVTGWHLFSAFSLVHIGGGRGAIVAYTMPVWAALFGALYLARALAPRRLAALSLGMLGIAILIGPDLLGLAAAYSGRC